MSLFLLEWSIKLCAMISLTAGAMAGAANFVFCFVSKGSGKSSSRYRLSVLRTPRVLAELGVVSGSSIQQHSLLKNTECLFATFPMLTRFCVNPCATRP